MAFETSAGRGAVQTHYGPRSINQKFGGELGSRDHIKIASWTYDYNDAPAAATSELEAKLPAYAKVTRMYTEIVVDVTLGGDRTGFTVQNVVGDVDSGADAAGALVRGTVIDHGITATDVGSAAAELVTTLTATGGASGDLTAGRLRTVVEYIVEAPIA